MNCGGLKDLGQKGKARIEILVVKRDCTDLHFCYLTDQLISALPMYL
jgi:hypothetical protein